MTPDKHCPEDPFQQIRITGHHQSSFPLRVNWLNHRYQRLARPEGRLAPTAGYGLIYQPNLIFQILIPIGFMLRLMSVVRIRVLLEIILVFQLPTAV